MIISTGRLLAAAAVFVIAVVGAGWLGRTSAPPSGANGPSPSVAPTPSASAGPTVESFRAARNALCVAARPSAATLNDAFANAYDPSQTPAERNATAEELQAIVDFGDALRAQLAALPVPPSMAADQAASLTRGEDLHVILGQEILLIKAGKLSEAQQLDLLTDPINRQVEQFEQKYNLEPCP